jgi:GNAT superfamily N-acetyltransferase
MGDDYSGPPNYEILQFTPGDVHQVMELQQTCLKKYPEAVRAGEMYLSPVFEGGKNVYCAFDEQGRMQGYAPIFLRFAAEPGLPHTIWAEVMVNPELRSPKKLKDLLFERVLNRAREITLPFPGHAVSLNFQYHAAQTSSIEYVLSKGCIYNQGFYRMIFDLSQKPPVFSIPDGIEVRQLRMESEPEQRAYIEAQNEANPVALLSQATWQFLLNSPGWNVTTLTAFNGKKIIGSVAEYWDEDLRRKSGKALGITDYVFVNAAWRRQGIAAFLVSQGLLYLKDHGLKEAGLEVRAANQPALNLYKKSGYIVVDESQVYSLRL